MKSLFRFFKRWTSRPRFFDGPGQPQLAHDDIIHIPELKTKFENELRVRHCPKVSPYAFSDYPGGPPTLLATTGAANIYAILGVDFGGFEERASWADYIASFGVENLRLSGLPDPEHALCMSIQAFNLLGCVPSLPSGCFTSDQTKHVESLVAEHDWTSTHKALWGKVAPLLASGLVSADWRAQLYKGIEQRLWDEKREHVTFGLPRKAPEWKTISVLYHLALIYDAARDRYPFPRDMIRRLLDLDWPASRKKVRSTFCSDADWAWLLTVLAQQNPELFLQVRKDIRRVAAARAQEWNAGVMEFSIISTHHLYCFLWSTARFQDLCREFFEGQFLPDTLNWPCLFRVKNVRGDTSGCCG